MLNNMHLSRFVASAALLFVSYVSYAGVLVSGVPQCTQWDFTEQEGSYYVTNSCGEAVDVKFTSQTGKMWGEATIGAGQRQAIGIFGVSGNPRTNGELWLYTCPQNTTPVQPNGSAFWSQSYHGGYLCASN